MFVDELLLAPPAPTALPAVDITAGAPLMQVGEPGCENPNLAPGFLSLNTAPWTRIEIDGEPVGSTPVFRMRLPPGAHQLALHNEAEGVTVERTVDILVLQADASEQGGGLRSVGVGGVFEESGEHCLRAVELAPLGVAECVGEGGRRGHLDSSAGRCWTAGGAQGSSGRRVRWRRSG